MITLSNGVRLYQLQDLDENYRFGSDYHYWSRRRRGAWCNENPNVDGWHRKEFTPNAGGYLRCIGRIDGRQRNLFQHRGVCELHHGPCPEGMECCHEDGVVTNNTPENLRWDTRKGNVRDMIRHGNHASGEDCNFSKLTNAQYVEIQTRGRNGETLCRLDEEFGLKRGASWYICRKMNLERLKV